MKIKLPKAEQVNQELQAEILAGKFGVAGSPFMTTRSLCDYKSVSLKTAHRILNMLKDEAFLELKGNRHYISTGPKVKQSYNKQKLIGFLATNLENPFFAGLARHLEYFAREAGYELMIASSNYDKDQEKEKLDLFCRMGITGILACPWGTEDNEGYYSQLPVPFVLIGRKFKNRSADAVMVNNQMAAQSVAAHFIKQGFKHFAYIGPSGVARDARLAGFRSELMTQGLNIDPNSILQLDNVSPEQDLSKISKLIKTINKHRTAIFCFHDLFAVRALKVCNQLGIKVPENIAIAGFDNLPVASEVYPALTSVSYPIRDMARIALETLIAKQNENYSEEGVTRYLESRLIIRQSSQADAENRLNEISSDCIEYQVS